MSTKSEKSVPKIRFEEPVIDYSEDRQAVLDRDLTIPPGQEFALVSYLENNPLALRIHGCFPTSEAAQAYMDTLVEKMSEKDRPVSKFTTVMATGYWVPWPPKSEYFTQEGYHVKAADADLERTLHQYYAGRLKQRKELVDKIFEESDNLDYDDILDLLTPKERELLRRK
jgi:hypothetical protein